MLPDDPEDLYRDYQRYLRKKDFRRAYQRLETMLREFPDDVQLLGDIIALCINDLHDAAKAKHWLKRLVALHNWWHDHLTLGRMHLLLSDFVKATQSLDDARRALVGAPLSREAKIAAKQECERIKRAVDCAQADPQAFARQLADHGRVIRPAQPIVKPRVPALKSKIKPATVTPAVMAPLSPIPALMSIETKFLPLSVEALAPFQNQSLLHMAKARLRLDFEHVLMQGEFNELICLNSLNGLDKYWYQIETVKKVLKHFHGRVLLCDEVGLGKTIEAGMLIKEYLMRHMARNCLVLVPSSLVSQWKEEMEVKFGVPFVTTEDPLFAKDPQQAWGSPFLIASIHTAKHENNLPFITQQFYDIVVVDEAHHLRNRTTKAWALVNAIQKKFIFLLTATPVQNNLIELFNLVTLLKPGQFKTEKMFKKEFLIKKDDSVAENKEKLRETLREIMIRNTRSAIDLKLPRRHAVTMRLTPTPMEEAVYRQLNDYLRANPLKKHAMHLLLQEAGSSPFALRESFLKMAAAGSSHEVVQGIDSEKEIAKGLALRDLLLKNRTGKKIIFTQFFKSVDYITRLLTRHGLDHEVFRGDMTAAQKDASIARFKESVDIIVSTESGGEGRNLQFCNTIINFDLPWNPMRIEQRIGRLHRIGQTKDVFVFNLSVRGTIEDYIIDILDNKINMFEMVIGEIEPILGQLGGEHDFEDVIMDIWLNCKDNGELGQKMENLGSDLIKAKQEYAAAKKLDENIFGDDYLT